MYLRPFSYVAVETVSEAVKTLSEYGDEARVLAGGQSLLPLIGLGLARPRILVDINGVDELDGIRDEGESLYIGALVRYRTLERDPAVRQGIPVLAKAASLVGNIRVRSRGTVGGSLAHADPAAELPCAVVALGGEVDLCGPGGRRRVPADEFFIGPLQTALTEGELVAGVLLPKLGPGSGWAFCELARRSGDFAVVAVCAVVELDGRGRCLRAAVAVAGVGPKPLRLRAVETLLAGSVLNPGLLLEAASEATALVQPSDDVFASAEYRRAMTGVMVRRALALAAKKAGHDLEGTSL